MKRLLLCAMAVLTVLAAGACGGPKSDPPTREDAMLDYARCMRDNGVDLPDPNDEGAVMVPRGRGAIDVQTDTFKRAQEACRKLSPGPVGERPSDSVEQQDKLLAMAACLREKGFDVPDPNVVDDRPITFDPTSPKFREAERECSRRTGLKVGDQFEGGG